VLAAPAPAASGEYKVVSRNGVTQDANGNWVQAYVERDMFADYVDEDGVTVTKASQEKHTQPLRMQRPLLPPVQSVTSLIASCDWMAIKAFEGGTTVSTEWATYRQALRDVSAQAGFPNTIVWPTQPEQ
jgi:hypothetical protein